jgi:hypothetical protein
MARRINFTKMYRPMAFGQTDITGTVYEARLKAQIRAQRRREDGLAMVSALALMVE